MRNLAFMLAAGVLTAALSSPANAQPPRKDADNSTKETKDYSNSSIVTRMMAFNKKNDGKLTKDEVTDTRLHRLFDEADANKDGIVTKDELMALAAKMDAQESQGGRGQGGPGGPGGGQGGGPGGGGGGRGGRMAGPPQPGQIMPVFLQETLKLTAEQKKQIDELQRTVDDKLAKILTDEQKAQLKEMRERGPGGPGGQGGRGPGGPPPKKDD